MSLLMGIEPNMTGMDYVIPNPLARKLRYYQDEAIAAVYKDWADGFQRVAVVLPTGVGKSSVVGGVISTDYLAGSRIAILAHRAELLDQIRDNILQVNPDIPPEHIGVVRGVHDDHTAPIVVATFQTLAKAHRAAALGLRDLIVVDETHHIVAKGYHETFKTLGGYEAHCRFLGVTATLFRSAKTKGKNAEIGLGDVIEKVSYERDLVWAIEEKWLVKPTGLTIRIAALDALNKIKTVAGDFHQGDLAEIMEAAVDFTCDAVEMHASDRRSIIFGASVEACKQIVDELNDRGNIKCALAIGTMSYEERKPVYAAFRAGEIQAMVTVAVLSEGADFPMCDAVIMARPTKSRILYSQMVGRALRTYENKSDALVMDLTGVTRQMKLVHLSELVHGLGVEIREADEDGEEIEVPTCPNTGEPVNTCECKECVDERTPPAPRVRVKREGIVDMVTIDLLDGSDTLWLETPAGVPFIDLGQHAPGEYVFVWPKDGMRSSGLWAVASVNKDTGRGGFSQTDIHGDEMYFPLATALRKAEKWVHDAKLPLPNRYAPWRTANQAPTAGQLHLAQSLSIPHFEDMTKGRVSDEISIAYVSARVDHAMVNEEAESA